MAEFSKVIVIDSDTRSASTATDRTLLPTLNARNIASKGR
jgi:hypothetical protein